VLTFDAEFFNGQIPTRAYLIRGLRISIPSNYDPINHTYSGVWDGTFQTRWSNNPAWVYYDLLTNQLRGLGDLVDASQVDKWSLYQIAQYCDAVNARPWNSDDNYSVTGKHGVPDGVGGFEPRFIFN
jgi:predicted phage tail protein